MITEAAEREEIATSLRGAVEASGLSQAAFARAIGTSPARLSTYLSGKTVPSAAIYLRALRFGDALAQARANGLMTAESTAQAVNRALDAGDEEWAFKMVVQGRDHLRSLCSHAPGALPAWTHRSSRIKDERYETLFKAIIGHEMEAGSHTRPTWTEHARLARPWLRANPFLGEAGTRERTPRWLAESNVFIAEKDLATA